VPWLRRTTSKQPHQAEHTGHGFAVARLKDKLMDMHTKTRAEDQDASHQQMSERIPEGQDMKGLGTIHKRQPYPFTFFNVGQATLTCIIKFDFTKKLS
jgi:hypothetical protein